MSLSVLPLLLPFPPAACASLVLAADVGAYTAKDRGPMRDGIGDDPFLAVSGQLRSIPRLAPVPRYSDRFQELSWHTRSVPIRIKR